MAKIQHPESLNPLQKYRQAGQIFRSTTRAKNPAWFQSALELDFQLHIRPDGPGVTSVYYDRRTEKWSDGPKLTEEILHNEEQTQSLIEDVLKYTHSQKAKSLGIILHVADEFATTDLKPELDNPGDISDLRDAAINEPASILEDSSIQVDQASWRVIPYPAAGSEIIGTTVTLSKSLAPFLSSMREAGEKTNFPVITHALSAPLVTIMGLPKFLKEQPTKPFVTILQYPWFTIMAFFNENADLKLIRTLQHRGVRTASNFRNALFTTSASLEFLDPDLYILPLGEDIDLALEPSLHAQFQSSKIEMVETVTSDALPPWAPELAIITDLDSNDKVQSNTFTSFKEEGWATQDFIPTPKEVAEIYPRKSEMRFLKLSRIARVAIILLTLLGLSYFGLGVLEVIKKPEWSFDPSQANITRARVTKLKAEQKTIEHWENLLSDRSKAWANMESLARMFPPEDGMLIQKYNYSAKPDITRGQAKVGFIKSWNISGMARFEAVQQRLNKLNTRDGINSHFTEIAKTTGNSAFNPSIGNRSISVNIRTRENNSYRPIPPEEAQMSDETSYPYTFDLTITQRFESDDPMAINVPKAP